VLSPPSLAQWKKRLAQKWHKTKTRGFAGNVLLWQGFTKQTLGKIAHQGVGELGLDAFSPS
jgi:hypothetical protein